jgi:hypothetical protein
MSPLRQAKTVARTQKLLQDLQSRDEDQLSDASEDDYAEWAEYYDSLNGAPDTPDDC